MYEVDEAIRRNSVALSSRLSALAIYGVTGILVGIFMALGGAPHLVEVRFGPDIRYLLGALAGVGGVLLAFGAIMDGGALNRRGWWISIIGVITFGLWAIVMAGTYGIIAGQAGFHIARPGVIVPVDAPRPYVPFLYQGFALLALLHVVTLLRLGRPPR
jgi:hypothetical protein